MYNPKCHTLIRAILLVAAAIFATQAYASDAATETHTEESHDIRIKTNAPSWLIFVTNVAVEFDPSRHISFALPIYYSGFNYFQRTLKFRVAFIQPELRYWFAQGHKGWFIGAHMGIGYYNYALGKGNYRIQDHNWDTPAWGGGLAFGYRMPLSKDHRWELEFCAGAGVYDVRYDKWENVHHGKRVESNIHKTWFGIDQLAVTFSYRFDVK